MKDFAIAEKLPFYILSGKYGLIPGNQKIPYYDYYLKESAIDMLVKTVIQQIKKEEISEIDFYAEDKISWIPYINVIKKAVRQANIKLNFRYF